MDEANIAQVIQAFRARGGTLTGINTQCQRSILSGAEEAENFLADSPFHT
ncbi:hypothetical protein FHS27_005080 [Rhodopirellula rubra]|uniref:Uncharacterized protein n=1 Tax=Aporhodopirellula rubra TaxID=980271 RepID=A0A7W5H744_9BACT|nr:hypothetical protein [Aporhodopirellula rubra]